MDTKFLIENEREECALLAETYKSYSDTGNLAQLIANAIRLRQKVDTTPRDLGFMIGFRLDSVVCLFDWDGSKKLEELAENRWKSSPHLHQDEKQVLIWEVDLSGKIGCFIGVWDSRTKKLDFVQI